MGCCGDTGLNQIASLDVPVNNGQMGTALDVSGLSREKTFEISGTYSGSYVVYGSHDGAVWAPLLFFSSGSSSQQVRQFTALVLKYVAVKKVSANVSTTVTMSVSAKAACNCDRDGSLGANEFLTLALIPSGAQVGPRDAVDLWSLVPANGLDPGFSVVCGGGSFEGLIGVEGSLDGVHFVPLGQALSNVAGRGDDAASQLEVAGFNVAIKQRVPGTSFATPELSPLVVPDVVRYVRANLRLGVIFQDVTLTIGGKQNCDCPTGGGCNMQVHPLISGTVGLWQFQGDLNDSSGNGYSLTPSPLVPPTGYEAMGCLLGVTMAPAPGGANVRDYYNMYNLAAPALALGGELTIEFLFLPRNGPADVVGYVSEYKDVAAPLKVLYEWDWSPNFVVTPGHNYFDHFFAGGELTPNVTNRGTNGVPNHYALRRKSTGGINLRVEIFINGILQPGSLDTTTEAAPGSEEFLVGGFSIDAAMATLRIVNYARSDAEILADAHLTLGT